MSKISDILNNSNEILGWSAVHTPNKTFKSQIAAIAIAILKTIACPIFFAKAYFANKNTTAVSQPSTTDSPSRGEASSTNTPVDKPEERFVPQPKEMDGIKSDYMRNLGFGDQKPISTSPIPISVGEHKDDQGTVSFDSPNLVAISSKAEHTYTLDSPTPMLPTQKIKLLKDTNDTEHSTLKDEEEVRPSSRVTKEAIIETLKFALPTLLGAVIGAARYYQQHKV
ncbi:MAG: hypothetical protein ACOYL1_06730 [Chlamydiia bacterium]